MNDSWRQKTVDTYNRSARQLTDYFRTYSREKDISKVFSLLGTTKNPFVLEIGCGDGRDAKEIIKRTKNYLGFDIAEKLVNIAKDYVPEAEFQVADATSFNYPDNVDAVFAFASLLHLDEHEIQVVFNKLKKAIKPGGVLYLSLKYSPVYREEIKIDQYGERLFYLYNSTLIKQFAGKQFKVIFCEENVAHGTSKNTWLEVILQKT